jgi:capsular polysaccharide biosynthesis protein
MPRRKITNYNNELNHLFDKVITDMSSLSFDEQVRLFRKCAFFVTIDGAQMTNVIFMNKKSKILVITTKENNCWTNLFGTNVCVDSVDECVLHYTDFNDNIVYNDKIQNVITSFVTQT